VLLTPHPAFAEEPPVLVDWLPWNHVLGGNCNFGLALFNGGTLYIDDGKPVPGQIEERAHNLREVEPPLYLNVPKGYEELVPWLRRDRALRETFISRVRMLQYAGASIAKLLRTSRFCPHAYRAAVWHSRHDILDLSGE
jgi:feruloyl-CoA synthase